MKSKVKFTIARKIAAPVFLFTLGSMVAGVLISCSQGGFKAKNNPLPPIEVTSATITNSGLQLVGKSLDYVTSLSLKQGSTNLPLSITSKSSKSLVASFLSGTITALTSFDFIMTSANAGVSQSATLTINLSGSNVTNFTSTGITDSATSSLLKLSSGGLVGIGTTAPTALLTTNANTGATLATAPTGTVLHVIPADTTAARISVDSFGAAPGIVLRRSSGTMAAPTALALNDVFGNYGGIGYGATGYASANRAAIKFNAAEAWTDANQGSYITFHTTTAATTTTSEVMRIDDTGQVGIGGTPTTKLHVIGTVAGNTMIITDGTGTCTINPSTAGNVTCTSDVRLKTEIQKVKEEEHLENLLKLNAVTYQWRKSPGETHTGFIAQEIEKVFPEFVHVGTDGFKQVATTALIPVMISSIKQLFKEFSQNRNRTELQISDLKKENEGLKLRLEKLERALAKNVSK